MTTPVDITTLEHAAERGHTHVQNVSTPALAVVARPHAPTSSLPTATASVIASMKQHEAVSRRTVDDNSRRHSVASGDGADDDL